VVITRHHRHKANRDLIVEQIDAADMTKLSISLVQSGVNWALHLHYTVKKISAILWRNVAGRFTDANVYGTRSVKIWKTRHHQIFVDIRIFYSVLHTVILILSHYRSVLDRSLALRVADGKRM